MAQIEDAIALGIGPQLSGRGTVNAFVRDATDLIEETASALGATGILLRNREDLSQSLDRIESDLGVVDGGRTRVPGGFIRVDPTLSFDIDMKGNGIATGVPDAGDFDAAEYLKEIFEGARLLEGTPTGSETPYAFGQPTTAQQFKTLKIWRGNVAPGSDESFTLQDCTFNLSWNYVAGEKSVMTVDVFAGLVIHNIVDTFPTSPEFGNQTDAAPILQLAAASIDGVTRGFTSASLSIGYPEIDVPDSNVAGGITKEIGSPREVTFTADWYADTGANDLDDIIIADGGVPIVFRLGQIAGAGVEVEAWRFDMPLFQGETSSKVDEESGKVVRTIDGTARHTTSDAELTVTAV